VWANDFVQEATMFETRQAVVWQRSTRCSNGTCVEVATVGSNSTEEQYFVRDSKDPQSPELTFDREAWRTFIEGVKNGDLDRR
jgi:hypothetical protein